MPLICPHGWSSPAYPAHAACAAPFVLAPKSQGDNLFLLLEEAEI